MLVLLDGAFIVESDGAVRSAGACLIPMSSAMDLRGGLGARHQAAAAILSET
ncbi:MAG: DNA integrity scanning protein DisA nucleotide-binding domain protein [Planctomycetaceae bacterium]|nr:DNA integrity scanning protein DisA nucleotide-binding domain protein [Planctomycetales bacterium]MCB9923557.1 DNA integrity scanning protein DisA nucleotide-binding domain protein [Planctomycetaceae bacterium]